MTSWAGAAVAQDHDARIATPAEMQAIRHLAAGPLTPPTPEALDGGADKAAKTDLYNEFFFVRQSRNTTAFINRTDIATYEYQASAIRNADGSLDVWYCTGTFPLNQNGDPEGGDGIYKSHFNSSNVAVGSPTLAVDHTTLKGAADGRFACDVSVIKHGHSSLNWPTGSIPATVSELYLMYYECAPHLTDRGNTAEKYLAGPNQVCLAASTDGVNWMKYQVGLASGREFDPAVTRPSPVIARDPSIDTICGLSETEITNEWVADFPECDYGLNPNLYGSGHPSAISLPTADPEDGDQREVWLYYYDSRGNWDQHGMYLRKSVDGVNFGAGQRIEMLGVDGEATGTVLHYNGCAGGHTENDHELGECIPHRLPFGKVHYFDVKVGNHNGVFIAPYVLGGHNYFSYSFDGIYWVNASQTYDPAEEIAWRADLLLAGARSDIDDGDRDLCVAPGAPAIVADKYGVLQSLTGVEILSGEGKMGMYDGCDGVDEPAYCAVCYDEDEDTNRGATWSVYMLTGDFGHIAPAGANVCTLYDEQNVRQEVERGASGSSGTIAWVDGTDYYGYSNWSDFLAKNNNDAKAYFNIDNPTFSLLTGSPGCGNAGVRPAYTAADSATVGRGLSVKIRVLDNDSGGLDATSIVTSTPAHGSVSLNSGILTYTHNGDAATSDSFTYTVRTSSGALLSSPATVSITIASLTTLYKINAGGATVIGGWAEDRTWASGGVPSSRTNAAGTGDATFATAAAITVDSSATGTPSAVFSDERYDPATTGENMKWDFPANPDQEVIVKLYLVENYLSYPSQIGVRIFDVKAEGTVTMNDVDVLSASYANAKNKGILRSFNTFSDSTLNLELVSQSGSAGLQPPSLAGIEIVGAPLSNSVPVANNDTTKVVNGWKTIVSVLGNDTDTGGSLDATSVTVVNNGAYGTAVANANGTITYTHGGGGLTTDRFSYTVRDNAGQLSNTATVTVTVKNATVLYRVNAGGSALTGSPNWVVDTSASPSSYSNYASMGNNTYVVTTTQTPVTAADGTTVPAGTPTDLFKSHRWDNAASSPNMSWTFPIAAGAGPEVEVRLYFSETWYGSPAAQRVMDISLEGVLFKDNLDVWSAAGGKDKGIMQMKRQSTDGTLNIDFVSVTSNPMVSGIEILGPN